MCQDIIRTWECGHVHSRIRRPCGRELRSGSLFCKIDTVNSTIPGQCPECSGPTQSSAAATSSTTEIQLALDTIQRVDQDRVDDLRVGFVSQPLPQRSALRESLPSRSLTNGASTAGQPDHRDLVAEYMARQQSVYYPSSLFSQPVQNYSTLFGQTTSGRTGGFRRHPTQSAPPVQFVNSQHSLLSSSTTYNNSNSLFGQTATGQLPSTQSSIFGRQLTQSSRPAQFADSQSSLFFGLQTRNNPTSLFGQTTTGQTGGFGRRPTQSSPPSQFANSQSSLLFSSTTHNNPTSLFGQTTTGQFNPNRSSIQGPSSKQFTTHRDPARQGAQSQGLSASPPMFWRLSSTTDNSNARGALEWRFRPPGPEGTPRDSRVGRGGFFKNANGRGLFGSRR